MNRFPINLHKMMMVILNESLKTLVSGVVSLNLDFWRLKKRGAFIREGAFNRTFTVVTTSGGNTCILSLTATGPYCVTFLAFFCIRDFPISVFPISITPFVLRVKLL